MFVVKHVPTGKFLKKTPGSHPGLYFTEGNEWRGLPLTEDINKARVYTQMGHVKSSLSSRPVIGRKDVVGYQGRIVKDVPIYGEARINPEMWEVLEVEISIKIKEE